MTGKFWTRAWNPVTGCTPCSPGCDNCWARRMMHRFGDDFSVKLHWDRINQPSRWKKAQTIFVCNLGDLFHPSVSFNAINGVWMQIFNNPRHTFLLVTKRPERLQEFTIRCANAKAWPPEDMWPGNVVLIATVCNQSEADERIPILLQTPAATRCVLIEPMLGPIDIAHFLGDAYSSWAGGFDNGVDGVLLGGETGPGARPMHPDWVRRVRDDCQEAGVPFFFKGWGEWVHINARILGERGNPKFHIWHDDNSTSKWVGPKGNSRLLDGREWNEVAW